MSTATTTRTKSAKIAQAALFHGVGQPLELVDIPLPQLHAGEALVQIRCCTICGSDLHTITGARTEACPSILGHEAVGIVTQIASEPPRDVAGAPVAVGDRVTWSTVINCGQCDRCQSGTPQKCRRVAKYGHEQAVGRTALNGGLANHLLLRVGSAIVKLTDDIPDEVICPVNCATATVAAMFRTAGSVAGQRVLIFGAGMLGLTAAAFAASRSADRIVVVDVDQRRADRALQFGATDAIAWDDSAEQFLNSLASGDGDTQFDVVLELSGATKAIERGAELADVGGRIVLAGTVMPSPPIQLDPEQIVRRLLKIIGVHNYAPTDLQTAVEFLEVHHQTFPFASLVEERFALGQINQAVEFALQKRPVRVAMIP